MTTKTVLDIWTWSMFSSCGISMHSTFAHLSSTFSVNFHRQMEFFVDRYLNSLQWFGVILMHLYPFLNVRLKKNYLLRTDLSSMDESKRLAFFLQIANEIFNPSNLPYGFTYVFYAFVWTLSYRLPFWLEFYSWRIEDVLQFCVDVAEYVFQR